MKRVFGIASISMVACASEPLHPLNEDPPTQSIPKTDTVVTDTCQCIGAQGIKGDDGERGESGTNGTNGINGIDGLNGADGKDGTNGTNGINGRDGLNGADGYTFLYVSSSNESCISLEGGLDTNRSGNLESEEVTVSETLCLPTPSIAIPYYNWRVNSPDNTAGNERCAFISKGWQAHWDDRECSLIGHVMCRRPDNSIFRSSGTGAFGKAPFICFSEGGKFSLPHNEVENETMDAFIPWSADFSWDNEITWINLTDLNLDGIWEVEKY